MMNKEHVGQSRVRGGAAPGRPAPSWPTSLSFAAAISSPPTNARSPADLRVAFHGGAPGAVPKPIGRPMPAGLAPSLGYKSRGARRLSLHN
jgi:hypothetical protein